MTRRSPARRAVLCAGLLVALQALAAEFPLRYWPAFPLPDRIVCSVSHNRVGFAEGVLLHTVAGLVAYDTRARNSGELVWIGLSGASSYDEWLERYLARQGVPREPGELGVWELVDRYRARGIIRGYVLVQWLMLNFCKGQEASQYWACPERGRLPFGWTVPAMDLLQVCPYTLDYLRDTASPRDDVVLLSGGYYYPDWFGQRRAEPDLLARHARRIGAYMDKCGISSLLVNLQDGDSVEALQAYQTYAREIPALRGIFTIQYAPYTAGGGAIRWVDLPGGRRVPVISARNALWAGRGDDPREGTPSRVAALLNTWAARPVERDENRFAWVIVHCWSWFRHGEAPASEEVDQSVPGEGEVARGYRPALWCSAGLAPNIRVVTPTALLNRLTRP